MTPLQIFPRHPESPDTYYIDGAWAPACITATDKRFSDGELAAEYWASERFYEQAKWSDDPETIQIDERCHILHRFATLPHHDADPA